jgi:hypothetical protein
MPSILGVFEVGELSIFGSKREEVRGWRKSHSCWLCDLYSIANMIIVIRSWKMRAVRHVAHTHGKDEKLIQVLEKLKERD